MSEQLLCKRCDVYVGTRAAGTVKQPEDVPTHQLDHICWVCRRTRDEIERVQSAFEPICTCEVHSDDADPNCPRHGADEAEEVSGTAVSTYVDRAMFEAEEMEEEALKAPKVYLLSASPDPLGSVAAMMMMYEGRVIRSLGEITDDERRHYFDQTFKTVLDTPLEAIDFHFMVEGVTRAHTHQEVRQRHAAFAQESMRFAVKEEIAARPGPLTRSNVATRKVWEGAVASIWEAYKYLIANGIPAEEARGLLPHDTLTRLHHKVNLRSLKQELGKRLCTQAQFDWRLWAHGVRDSIGNYKAPIPRPEPGHALYEDHIPKDGLGLPGVQIVTNAMDWQFRYIAESLLFRPICFQTGRCMFQADADRGCTIRERVDRGAFDEIATEEWAADPTAGWVR